MQLSASRDERHTHSAVPAAPLQTPAKAERRARNGPLGKHWGKQGTGLFGSDGARMPGAPGERMGGLPHGLIPRVSYGPLDKCRYFAPVKAEVFQADDEGSIPFTRSMFKNQRLVRNIEGAECALKSARGNVRGNKRPDFELRPREQDSKPADRRSYPLMRLRWNGEGS